ncbi:hypothetical protein A2368_00480 [Candidatus Collierbacteria bacterium RIFOXYB1_FULL_49_13]|uniref:Methyltransferase type 11 domain-containing protein n=1 Tax=Candidatus Collierbacteria bacterium RIFOXYB1_FULL_49_13 TaxID=1817728 RepID=A0A1F5FI40_9BACT|nr:MAG: hypothetical protein A2368_00480 [Candidatus Collierbacteria bacterium RIFOXYB1_FULL_49_13]
MTTRQISYGQHSQTWLDQFIAHLRYTRLHKLIPPNSRVLDLGCGYHANFLNSISTNIQHGTGIDLAVGRPARPNLQLLSLSTDAKLPFKNASFDVITALAIIEHVEHPHTMLREVYRLLRPGGKLLLTTPSLYGKPLLDALSLLRLISRAEILDHKRYYLPLTLRNALIQTGFTTPVVRSFGPLWLNILGVATK